MGHSPRAKFAVSYYLSVVMMGIVDTGTSGLVDTVSTSPCMLSLLHAI